MSQYGEHKTQSNTKYRVQSTKKNPIIQVLPPGVPYREELSENEILKMTQCRWNFPGKEGERTKVIVFADEDEVELLINGESCGKKRVGRVNSYHVTFEVIYQPGIIEAISYYNNMEYGREVLQ